MRVFTSFIKKEIVFTSIDLRSNKILYRTVYSKTQFEPLVTGNNNNMNPPVESQTNQTTENLREMLQEYNDQKKSRVKQPTEIPPTNTKEPMKETHTETSVETTQTYEVAYVSIKGKAKEKPDSSVQESSQGSSSSHLNVETTPIVEDTVTPLNERELRHNQLNEEDKAFCIRLDNTLRASIELLDANLRTHNINLQRTEEQRARWDNLQHRLVEYMNSLKRARWARYLGAATVVGTFAYYILRYQQLPLFNSVRRILGSAATIAPNAGNIAVNITLPPSPLPNNIPLPSYSTISEQFPLAGPISMGVCAGLLIALRFIKK
jgi:hypothetical protein